MKALLKSVVTEVSLVAKVALIAVLIMGGAAFAANFTDPTQSPPNGNVEAPINVGSTAQAKAGNFGANAIAGQWVQGVTGLCIGSDCRSAWPEGGGGGGTDLGTCTLDTKIVHSQSEGTVRFTDNHTGSTPGAELGSFCYNYLTTEETNENWTLIGFDNCPGVQGKDCAGTAYCSFIRLSCSDGVEVQKGETTRQVQPVITGGGGGGGGGGSNPNPEL